MKKIANGVRYNTETATAIADCDNRYPLNDFNYCREILYKTKNGNWFLFGEGGPMSTYAESVGNSSTGGSDIRPLSDGEAQNWLEEHDCVYELEEHFSDRIQDA
jgi:hypothetical protein